MEREAIKALTGELVRIDQTTTNNLRRIENLENQLNELKQKKIYMRRVRHRSNHNTKFPFLASKLVDWLINKMTKKNILLVILIVLFISWLFCRTYNKW